MADLMQSANVWLEGRREATLTGSITYIRGGTSLVLNSTMGETQYELEQSDGTMVERYTKDFIVLRADFFDTFGLPQIGDEIRQDIGTIENRYEVHTPVGESAFSQDSYELSFRINTQEIKC